MDEPVIILSNAGSGPEAQQIARALVREHLAAGVNIASRIQSVYRWQGEINEAEEWMMWIKTTRARVDQAIARLVELHSYDLPAAVIIPIDGGHAAYLEWMVSSVRLNDPESHLLA